MSEPKSVHVAVIGQGEALRHALDRLLRRSDFQVTAVCDPSASGDSPSLRISREARFVATPEPLLPNSEIDLFWFAGLHTDATEWMERMLAHGRSMVIDPLPLHDRELTERLARPHVDLRGRLLRFKQELCDGSFIAASQQGVQETLGPLRHARYLTWSPPLIKPLLPSGQKRQEEFGRVGSGFLDVAGGPLVLQLAQFIRRPAESVFCRVIEPTWETHLAGGELFLRVDYSEGTSAHIEINRQTCLTETSGWSLSGVRGGFRNGRLFQISDEGEVYDEAVAEPTISAEAPLDELARSLRAAPDARELDLIRSASRILEAARASHLSGQRVVLDPPS